MSRRSRTWSVRARRQWTSPLRCSIVRVHAFGDRCRTRRRIAFSTRSDSASTDTSRFRSIDRDCSSLSADPRGATVVASSYRRHHGRAPAPRSADRMRINYRPTVLHSTLSVRPSVRPPLAVYVSNSGQLFAAKSLTLTSVTPTTACVPA